MKISPHIRGGFYTTLTIEGKKHFLYGSSPEEIKGKYIEMKYKYQKGYDVNKNPTLESYMIQWYNAYKKDEGALKTQEMYRNCINNHINPALGSKKVKEITSTQVQTFLKSIKSSKSLAHKVRFTLNQIFKAAIADKIIEINPVTNTKVIAPDKPKREYLTSVQRELMLEILKEDRFYPIAFTILYTGMRMGEALALLWDDVDFENGIIKVTKAVEFDHSKPKIKAPKTERGIRDIPMPKVLADYLSEYKKTVNSKYVFPGPTGSQMSLTQIKRIYRKAKHKIDKLFKDKKNKDMEKHKFNLTFRLLRHTYCTGLFDANIDELSAAEIMGHDVIIMRKIYTHIQDERKQETIKKLESLYETKKDK